MSEQQAATATTTNRSEPDTSEPTPERQAELRAVYDANIAADKPPYEGEKISTLAEVGWILSERNWSGDQFLPKGKRRPDLRGASLVGANLGGASLVGANLREAYLRNADLSRARLDDADLSLTRLDGANLSRAGLDGANLGGARLVGANLSGAYLNHADLRGATLDGADLREAILPSADLRGNRLVGANLSRANLRSANLSEARLVNADLRGADLDGANLGGADLGSANLGGASLGNANLSGASLGNANLSEARLVGADLRGADLREATLDRATQLAGVTLDTKTILRDIDWQGVPLARVANWPARLGDEQFIKNAKNRRDRITAYRDAARAYRNPSIALRSQGLLIPASDYRLREQVLERKAKLLEFSLLGWAFSWLLNLVAGYGERPVRAFLAYLFVLFGFAAAYFGLGSGALGVFGLGTHDAITSPLSALVFSVTSFHGRGFFPGGLALDDPITVLAALEAVIGLFIEITFIATFTQRFFGGR